MDRGKVRLSLQVPEELNRILETMASEMGGTKSEVLRKALALMEVAHQARKNGKRFGIASEGAKLDTEIIGV